MSEAKQIQSRMADHWERESAARARKHAERVPETRIQEGEMVLMAKAFYEKGQGVLLPQCDGPYVVVKTPTAHTAVLEDPLTREPYRKGLPVSVARLVRFRFPPAWAEPLAEEIECQDKIFHSIKVGEFVACEPKTSQYHRVHVGRIERIWYEEKQAEVTLYHVAPGGRTGPWQRRRWEVWTKESGEVRREVVTSSEIVCKVELVEGALTPDSLERLVTHGIDAGTQPRRDHTLPPRSIQRCTHIAHDPEWQLFGKAYSSDNRII